MLNSDQVHPPELLAMGRVSVDMYPNRVGTPLADVGGYIPSVGGTATNVSVAAARLGRRAAIATAVGDDPLGRYVTAALERFGVDTRWVVVRASEATPVVFIELDPATEPSIWFYRKPSAPDEHLAIDGLDPTVIEEVPVLWIPGSRMAFPAAAATTEAVLAMRGRTAHTVIDLDYRPMFWDAAADAGRAVEPLLSKATVAVGNLEECAVTVGSDDPTEAAARLLERGLDLAVVKMGADGVMAVTADGRSAVAPPTPVEAVCGLGAGDAFGGMLVHGLLEGWEPQQTMTYANAAGAIVASRLRCSDDMPTLAEVEHMLSVGTPPPGPPTGIEMGPGPDNEETTA
ncbi:MAG: 5-dehydro-2-deoxygluconokinase [Actinomycetota bacterium]